MVSRETPSVPPETPDVARRVFSSGQLGHLEAYAASLADAGMVRGLIGPREVPRLWERHLLNCAALAELIPPDSTVCDIGSGAGLPGVVLAIVRPDLRITLVEPLLRRTTYLDEVVDELGLENVEVVRGRADVLHGSRSFDVVTSRAVAPLGRLLGWSMPLVAAAGAMVAMKGGACAEEIEAARPLLSTLGCSEPEQIQIGADLTDPPTYAVRVAWSGPPTVGLAGPPTARKRTKQAQRHKKRP